MSKSEQFASACMQAVQNQAQRKTIEQNVSNYFVQFQESLGQFEHLETARNRAANIRHKTIEYLDTHLIDFEAALNKRGVKVIWANDAAEANREIITYLRSKNTTKVVKSKSTVASEIGLTNFLSDEGIKVIESDTGDYLANLLHTESAHPIVPVIHKSLVEIRTLFNNDSLTHEQINAIVKTRIADEIKEATVAITGATFLLSDIGGVVITENEGNNLASIANTESLVVVAGIDKILSSINDLDLFLPLISTYGTGQNITSFNTIITGPKQADEKQGPSEMIVVLVDNGRSNLLAKTDQRKAALCIRCGACLLHDQIYRMIGGDTYKTVNKGVIGSIINQHLADEEEYSFQSFQYPLDGKIKETCPVSMDFNKLILYNRRDNVVNNLISRSDSIAMFFYKNAVMKRSSMEKGGAKLKNFMLRQFFKKSWGEKRELPKIAPESFNEQWRSRK